MGSIARGLIVGAAAIGTILSTSTLAQDSAPREGEWGVATQHLSDTTDPGDDFYFYVNEGWIEGTEIPADRSFLNAPWVAQGEVLDDVADLVAALLNQPRGEPGTAQRRLQDFHRGFMDTARIDALGTGPIEPGLAEIAAIESHEDVARWMARAMASSLFHLVVKPPIDMQGGYVVSLEQYRVTGLGLPGQVYYKSEDEPYDGHRAAYRDYIARSFELAEIDDGRARAAQVVELETRFANVMWDFARLRDAGAAFDLIPVAELDTRAPGFPWQAYLEAKGLDDLEQINFGIGGMTESAALFEEISLDAWKSYLAFHWIENHAAYLPDAFGEHRFAFFNRRLFGIEERPGRDDRATQFIERQLGWDIGSLYVAEHFPPSHSQKVLGIAEYVRRAFRDQLGETAWMDDATRAEALTKVDAIIFEMAEPQAVLDLSALETLPTDLIGNVVRLREEQWARQRERIGQPIIRYGDWNMYPHRVGLGFHQQYNKIFITAGALLSPFFDPGADMAVNFGSIGSTIGHEFGHSLDDQGSRFDSRGALREWWTPDARAAYEAQTARLIEQFGDYEVLPGVALKSDQMIGEIVGDLTGALIGYRAYQLYLEDHPDEAGLVLDGFTGPQRYWLGLTQKTRMVASEEALRDMALRASHPPVPPAINGVVTNLEEWYRDFGTEEGDALFLPESERVRLW